MSYIDPYVHDICRTPIVEGRKGFLRLDMNENPDGLPREFFDEVWKEVTPEYLAMYPEDGEFRKAYAKYLGLSTEQVLDTDGSVTAIQYIMKVFGEPGKDVVAVTPSFGMYYVNAKLFGINVVPVPYEPDLTFDINKILSAINAKTTIVVLVNPNMPVGNVYDENDIRKIVVKAKEFGTLVVIDEAYYYFYKKSSIDLVNEFDNVIVLRTFSKLLSIPGLRLGTVISNPSFITYLSNYQSHFTVNSVALLFGQRIIENADALVPQLETIAYEGRSYLMDSLSKHGYRILPSYGCFVTFKPLHRSVDYIYNSLYKQKILVLEGKRSLEGFLRVTTAAKPLMERFLGAFYQIDR